MDENSTDFCYRIILGRVTNFKKFPVYTLVRDYEQIILLMFSNYWYHAIPSVIFMTSISAALKTHINSSYFGGFCKIPLIRGHLKLFLNLFLYSLSLFGWLLFSEFIYCNVLILMKDATMIQQWLEKFRPIYKKDNYRVIIFWVSLSISIYLSLFFSYLIARQYYERLKFSYIMPTRLFSRLKRNSLKTEHEKPIKEIVKSQALKKASESDEESEIHFELRPNKNQSNKIKWKPAALDSSKKTRRIK